MSTHRQVFVMRYLCNPNRTLLAVAAAAGTLCAGADSCATELIRLEFEDASDLAANTSGSGISGVIDQTGTNFFGTFAQSTEVRPGSTGAGSLALNAGSSTEGFFIEFVDEQFPDFAPTDSWTLSLWIKPTAAYLSDTDGSRGIVAGLSEINNTNQDWQIDNGLNGEDTPVRLATFGTANLREDDSDLVADQWQELTFAYLGGIVNTLLVYIDGGQPNSIGLNAGATSGIGMESFLVGTNRGKARVFDGLMDDLVFTDESLVFDANGESQAYGDLNLDGVVDAADWTAFKNGQGVDLAGLPAFDAYMRGDMNFDGDNDIFDFTYFKERFDAVNGVGALDALIAAVPEAGSISLAVACAVCGLVRLRSARSSLGHVGARTLCPVFIIALSVSGSARGQIVFDFGRGDVDGNTGVAANFVIPDDSPLTTLTSTQEGIEMTLLGITTNTPGLYDSNSQGFGIVSAGDTDGAGDQRRLDTANDGETVQFSFDTDVFLSSLRVGALSSPDEGFELAFVSGDDPFAGGSFTYTTTDNGATEGPTFDIPLGQIPLNAGTVLEFRTLNEGAGGILWNDLSVFTGTPARPLTLQVFNTGELVLVGGTEGGSSPAPGIEIDVIEITSADAAVDGGSLDPSGFVGLGADAAFPIGDGTGGGWEVGLANSDTAVFESFLLGSSVVLTDQEVSLGAAFVPGGEQDLAFRYREVGSGDIIVGVVEYIAVALDGDFNGDGVVNAADYTVWRDNLNGDESTLSGNGDGSGTVDGGDYALWRDNFGAVASAASSGEAIPEPATLGMLSFCCAAGAARRR